MNKYLINLSEEFHNMFLFTLLPFKSFSPSYVNLIHAKVYYFLDIASYFPYSFPKFISPKETSEIRKIIIDKRFIVFFKIESNILKVVYFVDGRREYNNMIIY